MVSWPSDWAVQRSVIPPNTTQHGSKKPLQRDCTALLTPERRLDHPVSGEPYKHWARNASDTACVLSKIPNSWPICEIDKYRWKYAQRTISCSTASATASSRGKKSKQWKQHSNKKWRNYNTNLSCNLSQDFSYHYANRSYLTRTMSFDGTIPLND